MHVLGASREPGERPELAWSRDAQRRIGEQLARGRDRLRTADRAGWAALKAEWRAFVLEHAAGVRAAAGKPLAAKVLSRTTHDGYVIERILFDSFPGWSVGLDLFLPVGEGPWIPVLCPCGHGPKWQDDHQIPPQVLARSGFAAALFDMPMFGEKTAGNDHFIQGAQAAMTGIWPNWFFLVDAVRVADYLGARPDIDTGRGLAVTGVSGGGMATMYLATIDPRVRVVAPVCSVASLGGHVVEGLYTGCPENYMSGQAALGLDMDHLLCLAAPLPCLVVGGTEDTLFRKTVMEASVAQARRVWELEGVPERLDLWFDNVAHTYTVAMAMKVAAWFHRWLDGDGTRAGEPLTGVTPLSREELDCGSAATTTGMVDVITAEAKRLARERIVDTTDRRIRSLCRLRTTAPSVVERLPRPVWGYPHLDRHVVRTEGEPDLPVLVAEFPAAAEGTLVVIGDTPKLERLRQGEGLFGVCRTVVSADIRGYGELAAEPTSYDLYGWCAVDRPLSDLLVLCGLTPLGEQVADVLRVLDTTPGRGPVTVMGRGEPSLAVLFAGLLHPRVSAVALDSYPCSFESIATAVSPRWSRYVYLPEVLAAFDLPLLVAARTDRRFLLCRPRGADATPLSESSARELYGDGAPHVRLVPVVAAGEMAGLLSEWMTAV